MQGYNLTTVSLCLTQHRALLSYWNVVRPVTSSVNRVYITGRCWRSNARRQLLDPDLGIAIG